MDLQSILVITYLAAGTPIQSELTMPHAQCMAAETNISARLRGPASLRPMVEMLSGEFAPMVDATCLPACIPDALGLEPLDLLTNSEDA